MDNLTIFIAVTAAAVVIQAGILVAMYLAVRQSTARLEALANEVRNKVLPTAELAQSMLTEARPKLENLITNLSDSSTILHSQLERVDATVNDVIDRARLQVIRADELVGRTLDRVEQTTDLVHKTVVSPVRQVSGLFQGVVAGMEFFFAGKNRQRGRAPVAQDEMFI
jgi:chromatin segregation and condensation protein Rec8/ScpA/Scc1 (kleisin family)